MIKKLLLLTAFLLFKSNLRAQEHFIIYNNNLEQKLLSSANTPADFIQLALAADVSPEKANALLVQLNQAAKNLGWENSANQKPDKRLKALFANIHKTFLRKYEEEAVFSNLFETGEYQCVGASILYAYLLEQFQIPYQIKETPTHVYVVAYPGSYSIMLETTDPAKGYFVPDDKAKAQYIKALVKGKYLEQEYIDKVGVDQAFNEFFYSKTSITLKDAVGLLYYNKAIEKLQQEKMSEAYSAIAKAQTVYPAKKTEFLKKEVLAEMIGNFKFNDLSDWEALMYLVNAKDATEEAKNYLRYKFVSFIDTKLWKEGKKDKLTEVFDYLQKTVTDSTTKVAIAENYYYENGRYNYMANNSSEALQYLEKALASNGKNPLITSMVASIITRKFAGQSPSVSNVAALDQLVAKYPFMAKDPMMRSIYLYNFSFIAYNAFKREDKETGEKYMKMMVNEIETFKEHERKDETQLASVFGIASEYYYRSAGSKKCIDILTAGLKYFPNDETLQRKLNIVKSNLKK